MTDAERQRIVDLTKQQTMSTVTDTSNYYAKSTTFGIDWHCPHTTKERAIERAQWFVNEWTKVGVEASVRVYYRNGEPVADFSSAIHQSQCRILNPIEVSTVKR